MRFWEAMKALEEGERVRLRSWAKGVFIDLAHVRKHPKAECNMGINTDGHYFFRGFRLNEVLEEWELYEEFPKTYTFMEVVNGLKEGKRFRRKGWVGDLSLYIFLRTEDEGIERYLVLESRGVEYRFTTFDFEATDWIEVK